MECHDSCYTNSCFISKSLIQITHWRTQHNFCIGKKLCQYSIESLCKYCFSSSKWRQLKFHYQNNYLKRKIGIHLWPHPFGNRTFQQSCSWTTSSGCVGRRLPWCSAVRAVSVRLFDQSMAPRQSFCCMGRRHRSVSQRSIGRNACCVCSLISLLGGLSAMENFKMSREISFGGAKTRLNTSLFTGSSPFF